MRINKEGFVIIAVAFCTALLVSALSILFLPLVVAIVLSVAALFVFIFITAFFREPRREAPRDPSLVYAPADGTVVVAEEVEETEFLNERRIQVSVFMSLTNVHVNWYPIGGKVVYFKYHPGTFLVAWHPKSSEENERTTTVVDTGKYRILFRQIAGFIARRIVSYAEVGRTCVQNEKCGFIKFGSRVDVMLPLDSEILVEIGQKVVGSQTPIARLK